MKKDLKPTETVGGHSPSTVEGGSNKKNILYKKYSLYLTR